MDIYFTIEELILDGSPVFIAYPDEEIYSEVVGIGDSAEEARRDLARTFNQMMYNENDALILIDA